MPIFKCLNCGKEKQYFPSQSTGKYCNNKCQQEYIYKTKSIPRIERGEKFSGDIRKYLIEKCGEICSLCSIGPVWNDKPLKLQIDHIDGDRNNNKIENLRILCPNCHSQTPTYGALNIKKKNVSDEELLKSLYENSNTHQALLGVNLAITSANYKRCYKLLEKFPPVSPPPDKRSKG